MSAAELGTRERFERWLAEVEPDLALTGWRPLGGGRSATTVRVGLGGRGERIDAVLHLEPTAGPLAGVSKADRQYRLLEALREVPEAKAPAPLWHCPDPGPLGAPFFVCEFLAGDVPTPWNEEGRELLAGQRPGGALARSFLEALAAIHSVPLGRVGDGEDPRQAAATHADRERERWTSVLRRSRAFGEDPVMLFAEAWLRANRPDPGRPGLVHGDYRVGNLVIEGERVVGVLDWELAEVGDPRFDLGTLCAEPLQTRGLAGGLWEPRELLRAYGELRGEAVDPGAVAYFRVLATFKIASLWVNASLAFERGEEDMASLRAGFSALEVRQMLARALGLSVPDAVEATDPRARAAAVLRRALAEQVAPAVEDGEAEAALASAVAILGTWRRAAPAGANERLGAAVEAAERAAGAEGAELAAAGEAPSRRLATLVQQLPELGGGEARGLIADAVGLAALPDLGAWP